MSLTSAMTIATSGMRAAQTGLRTVSDNIANVNTVGYARKVVDQSPTVISGSGAGVTVDGVRRATDVYLQKATLDASAEVGRSGAVAEFYDRAQALFGDPSESSSFFNRLDPIFTAFSTASVDSTSSLRRSEINVQIKRFFDEASDIGGQLRELSRQTDVRIGSVVDRANGLLDDINALNVQISRATVTGADASGSENVQSRLIDELSSLVDLRVGRGVNGGVTLAASDGTRLTGDNPGRFEFASKNGEPGIVQLSFQFGQPSVPAEGFVGGELKGLIELRDRMLPDLAEQLGEFTTRAADALNRAHNAASTAPAPTRLTGRPMSASLPDLIEGFTGRSAIAITDANGVVQRRVDIDFGARTFSINGGGTTTWTPGGFQLAIDGALSPAADLTYDIAAGGVLGIAATGAGRVSVTDDPSAPSDRGGRGFSHYFGLNDLVDSTGPAFYDNGLTTSDPHWFAPGGEISFRFQDGTGARFSDVTVAVPTGGTLGDLLTALNGTSGVAKVGSFALENGALRFTSKPQPQVALTVIRDDTVQGSDGRSLSAVHGLGAMRAARAESFALRPAIAGDTNAIALAKFSFGAAVGAQGLSLGDGRGAFGLAQTGEAAMRFERAGEIAAATTSLSSYAAQFGGAVGRRAAIASERSEGAEIVLKESAARRSAVEGVNLDEELIQLTVYQQAFSASARLITAAKEMYDVLLSIA